MKASFGSIVVAGSGKLGGSVVKSSRSGVIIGKKNMPSSSPSSSQAARRSELGKISQSWRTLSEQERLAWSAAALQRPVLDVWGNSRILDGYHFFVSCNRWRLMAGASVLSAPVGLGNWERGVLDVAECWSEDSDWNYSIVLLEPSSPFGDVFLSASRQVSPGVSPSSVPVSLLEFYPSGNNYEFGWYRPYEERFGKVQPSTFRFKVVLNFVCPLSGILYQVLPVWMPQMSIY